MADELWRKNARELAMMIARGETTSTAVVEAHLERIAAVNPALNAVVVVLADDARQAAATADRAVATGQPLAPLHGVPFTIKENIDVAGQPTTNGVPALANAMATLDHPMVERFKAAGAIPIGRTNLPDMALRIHTDSALYGLCKNPWNSGVTAGGSSGGDASALAAGMTPLGLGNDIGGSLRNPAFCCGIASLKPGLGRIPSASSIEPMSGVLVGQMMAVQGPMARSVGDLRLALGILAGPHPRDPWSFPAPLEGPSPTRPLKVALVANPPGGTTDAGIAAAVEQAGKELSAAGYAVESVAPPTVEEAIETWGRWLSWELGLQGDVFRQLMSDEAFAFWEAFVGHFGTPTYADGVALMVKRHEIARAWSEFFARYPVIVGPTWCQPQFAHGYDIAAPGGVAETINLMRFVTPMNLLGLPVVCVPTGVTNGLPVGVQVIGDRFREDLCLEVGEALEGRVGTITPIDPR